MKSQKGKITISSILISIILIYLGFAAFKILGSRFSKSQIKNEIIEKFGFIRGTDFTPEKGEQVIMKIMEEHGLYRDVYEEDDENSDEPRDNTGYFDPKIHVELQGAKILFTVEYVEFINLMFFKMRAVYLIEDDMLNYN